jgi:hypothetical protein
VARSQTPRSFEEEKKKWVPTAFSGAYAKAEQVGEYSRAVTPSRLAKHGLAWRIVAGVGFFLLAFGTLLVLNFLLRSWGLWGDLAFALVVTTAALWVLTRVTQPLRRKGKDVWAFPRALAATTTALIGLPVAVVTWPIGPILLATPVLVWIAIVLARVLRRENPVREVLLPPMWPAALAGVALILLFVALRPPLSPADTVPRAVPAAQIEQADGEIAEVFRPILFFDMGERRYPLDIEDAIAERRISMCRDGVRGDECVELETAAELDDSFEYLEVTDAPGERRGGDDRSAYYYHVVEDGETVYVDYWWFYSRNPSPVADKVFCGPGLRTPPFTCQEHAGDWEGVTVVLEPCAQESESCVDVGANLLEPIAVRYAQHERVRQYSWQELEARWRELPRPTSPALGPVWDEFVLPTAAEHGSRPLVFVARNSHASYAVACLASCKQQGRDLPEGRFDGGQPWTHNLGDCDQCLKPLPLTAGGDPALWNAFSGRWGEQSCILAGAYCDLSPAPRGPSNQKRYDEPAGA